MRYLENGTSAYWYVALDGSSAEQLRPPAAALSGDFACAFSPDGRASSTRIVPDAFSQLFVFDLRDAHASSS